MDDLSVLAQLPDEFLDAFFINELLLFRRLGSFVGQRDFETGIQEGELAQTARQPIEFKLGRDRKDRGVGKNVMSVPVVFFFFFCGGAARLRIADAL